MSGQHTPGPWNEWATPDDLDMSHEICANNRLPIAIIYDGEKAQANARLIAAAPDLLEAAQALLNRWLGGDGDMDDDDRIERNMRAAIAKASGK